MAVKNTNDSGNEKVCAILSYLLIGLVWYLVDEKVKQSEFAKYHVKQGLALLIAALAYSVAIYMLIVISLGSLIPLAIILRCIPLIWVVIGMINAANNNMKPLPLIGEFGEKFSF